MYTGERNSLARSYGVYSGDITFLTALVKFYDCGGEWEKGHNYWRFKFSDSGWLVWWTNNNCLTIAGSYEDRTCHANQLLSTFDDFGEDVADFLNYEVLPEFNFGLTCFDGGEDE